MAKDDGKMDVHYFNMEDCVLAAMEEEHITCPEHPDQPVLLQELVPELFMTDFPARYCFSDSWKILKLNDIKTELRI